MALSRLERSTAPDSIDFYYLDLLQYRSISNEIASIFKCPVEYIGNRIENKISLCDNSKIFKHLGWQPKINVLEWLSDNI